MKEEQRKRIIDKHRDSLTRHGYHPNALYWSSREIQEIRFNVLADIGIQNGDSVLDVGCGFADFKSWIEGQGVPVHFTGVDISPDLIYTARERHPECELLCAELSDFELENGAFDWVVLSGAMNEQLHDEGEYARRQIARMYALCRKGVAFNMLDARHLRAHDLQSVDPLEMLAYCKTLCPNCELHDDYLANDFTIYMRR
ncbi:class I SAM-dependent methyltransferase [Mariprofundus sp. NF]|uniref:class I SAM-dependent methyltransferase n=1 Tax=Mariprofundus sp. NF TaxID=2608716 RepID=UPI0015A1D32A|nr:class I SAM-dependent methyltransferase [Mariprofundus sp. NF]NWF39577.1 class I SAM-dependent methyltransferase [Mariprofundus sp. NF]